MFSKFFANSRPSASNFKRFSRSLEQFLLTVGQNNFGNKIPFLSYCISFSIFQFMEKEKGNWPTYFLCQKVDNVDMIDHRFSATIDSDYLKTLLSDRQ